MTENRLHPVTGDSHNSLDLFCTNTVMLVVFNFQWTVYNKDAHAAVCCTDLQTMSMTVHQRWHSIVRQYKVICTYCNGNYFLRLLSVSLHLNDNFIAILCFLLHHYSHVGWIYKDIPPTYFTNFIIILISCNHRWSPLSLISWPLSQLREVPCLHHQDDSLTSEFSLWEVFLKLFDDRFRTGMLGMFIKRCCLILITVWIIVQGK